MSGDVFSCYLIGADTLLMECGEILLSEGHDVHGVVTSEPRVARWARGHDIPVIDAGPEYPERLAEREPFDFLFAITHLAIIPDRVLELPRRMAVNFHDGPLPAYAGLNAPVWALMNGEARYGITWHVITAGVDRGGILKQAHFDVGAAETALSINTRCLAAATDTFPELIRELAAGAESVTEQDPSLRSYFGKYDRPGAACTIDWEAPASTVEAFVRALSFGPYPNPVGVPKSASAERTHAPFVVTATEIVESGSDAAPGTVTGVTPEGITVATGEGAVRITGARLLDGADVAAERLGRTLGIEQGDTLLSPSDPAGVAVGELDERARRAEEHWIARLRQLEPPELPQSQSRSESPPAWSSRPLNLPAGLFEAFGVGAPDAVVAALAAYLARVGRKPVFDLALQLPAGSVVPGWYAETVPLRLALDEAAAGSDLVELAASARSAAEAKGPYLSDLVLRQPDLAARGELLDGSALPVGLRLGDRNDPPTGASALVLEVGNDASTAVLHYDTARLPETDLDAIARSVERCIASLAADPTRPWTELELVGADELKQQLETWNNTAVPYLADACVHQLFEAQVDRTPDAPALVFEGETLTYQELDRRADALAWTLREMGIGPDSFVGVHVERSLDLLVATLGTLKAGGAYVPLDPAFPADRIAFMIEDSGAQVIVTQTDLAATLPESDARLIRIDSARDLSSIGTGRPPAVAGPENLAYAIYTSGSTGKPKGVLVEHRNVSNFFTGMDAVIEHDPPGVWLAVTSLSFDISVLELFWTLARGFKVVVYRDRSWQGNGAASASARVTGRPMDFGLFMWGNDDGAAADKYKLMLDAARYFDQQGFNSVWTPERHFHAFGGPFPNPSVTGAALAAVTENVAIRSGSCVSPLHHPIRIAEEWGVVDNLSGGRVGLAFAAGWQPNDFVLRPESFPNQKQVMMDQIDVVRRLWRGESVEFENPLGNPVPIRTLPRPVQAELPYWITTAGNPETYRTAGAMGANVLTHLLGQSIDEVAEKIAIYREARAEAGLDPAEGVVTLMLHTYVGESDEEVREIVRQPMKDYLGASMKLVLGFAWTFPAFKRPGGPDAEVEDVDLSSLTPEETDAILDFAFERYYETSGLFGTIDSCVHMVERCKEIDVDEIACLLDYGVPHDLVLDSLPRLKEVRDVANSVSEQPAASESGTDFGIAAQIADQGVTHLQCTPSMAQMLLADPDNRRALGTVRQLMIGGEAFPPALARDLASASSGSITNMYGPTETTIWSSTHRLAEEIPESIPIGRPIANTSLYVLDPYHQPLPVGVPGELYIGGDGVTRGYHAREELTAERFRPDPFSDGGRMYATGDLVRYQADGVLDFIGRVDHQVKVRGYRIELGEIESLLNVHPDVQVGAVVVREPQEGDQRLVAFLVPSNGAVDDGELKEHLRRGLPEYMVPAHFVVLEEMPLTPNGKIDRKALPDVQEASARPTVEFVAPSGGLESTIAACWQQTLGLDRVGARDNFFDIGGHSLLVVQLHRLLTERVEQPISLVDLYRFPTIRALTDHLGESGAPETDLQDTADRAQKRRQMMARRRRG